MALSSFVESALQAYRLKEGTADLFRNSTETGISPVIALCESSVSARIQAAIDILADIFQSRCVAIEFSSPVRGAVQMLKSAFWRRSIIIEICVSVRNAKLNGEMFCNDIP